MSSFNNQIHFILGSGSPRRKDLLNQIGILPNIVVKPEIDEDILAKELPLTYLNRIVQQKMNTIKNKYPESLILTADTIVCVGRRVLKKTLIKEEAKKYLELLSGRRHRVITGICMASPSFKQRIKNVTSIIKFKRLSIDEINFYLKTNEWKNKAGGYAIQGIASRYVNFISGSYSNVVGLPLSNVYRLLISAGYITNNENS